MNRALLALLKEGSHDKNAGLIRTVFIRLSVRASAALLCWENLKKRCRCCLRYKPLCIMLLATCYFSLVWECCWHGECFDVWNDDTTLVIASSCVFLSSQTLDLMTLVCSCGLKHGEKRERKVHVNFKTFGRHWLPCSCDPTVLPLTPMYCPMLLAIWSYKRKKSGNCHLSWLRICTFLYLISR